jgi:zinc transporter 1
LIEDASLKNFQGQAKIINECFHAYGIHSATIQPELSMGMRQRREGEEPTPATKPACQMNCGSVCEKMTCCG